MAHMHPGVQLLLLSGLMIFWLIPLSSWLMLSGQRDRNATLWFAGTGINAVAASLFVFGKWLPPLLTGPLLSALTLLTVFMLVESLRRELPLPRVPRWLYGLLVAIHFAQLAILLEVGLYDIPGRVVHMLVLSSVEIYLIWLTHVVRRHHQSKSLWLIMGMFAAYVVSNLGRVVELWLTGRFSLLLDFTLVGNFALMVNYLGVIIYCYGYWGFVVEKNRKQLVLATEEAVLAREAEKLAAEREQLAREALRERTELMQRLTLIGKQAQAGAMSASIAHEVNQPLAAIQLNVEEAQRLASECQSPAPLQNLLARIEEDNIRAAEIVRRVRSLFSQSQMRLQAQVIDDMVRFVTEMMKRRIHRDNVQIKLTLNAPEPFQCATGEVEHVVMNLLENAMDALLSSPEGQRQIEICTWMEPGWVVLSVTDNGPGVPVELRERVFELYQSSKPQGLGLGLWLAHYIVQRHGGRLQLDKAHATGARFVLRLPRH